MVWGEVKDPHYLYFLDLTSYYGFELVQFTYLDNAAPLQPVTPASPEMNKARIANVDQLAYKGNKAVLPEDIKDITISKYNIRFLCSYKDSTGNKLFLCYAPNPPRSENDTSGQQQLRSVTITPDSSTQHTTTWNCNIKIDTNRDWYFWCRYVKPTAPPIKKVINKIRLIYIVSSKLPINEHLWINDSMFSVQLNVKTYFFNPIANKNADRNKEQVVAELSIDEINVTTPNYNITANITATIRTMSCEYGFMLYSRHGSLMAANYGGSPSPGSVIQIKIYNQYISQSIDQSSNNNYLDLIVAFGGSYHSVTNEWMP